MVTGEFLAEMASNVEMFSFDDVIIGVAGIPYVHILAINSSYEFANHYIGRLNSFKC